MNNPNSMPVRPTQSSRKHHMSRRHHETGQNMHGSPMRGYNSSAANYQHENLTNHYCTPPRVGKQQQQQQQQRQVQQQPNSQTQTQNQQKKKTKRSLFSRASKQLKQKISKEESTYDGSAEEMHNDEDTYIREARDPSPTNEMKYSVLFNGNRNHNNNGTNEAVLADDDRWRGQNGGLDEYQEGLEELGIDFTIPNQMMEEVVISTSTFPNQLQDVVISPRSMSQIHSAGALSPMTERDYQGRIRQKVVNVRDVDARRHQYQECMRQYHSNDSCHETVRMEMEHEMDVLRTQLAQREDEMENETTKLREELRKQKQKMEAMQENSTTKSNEYTAKLESDLEAYKRKCTTYREQLLQKERENAKVEQALYNERRKVLSLESENETLINVAEEKVGNAMTSEKAKASELKKYRDQFEKYRDEITKMEQALRNERQKVSILESENETLTKLAEEKVSNAMNLEKAKTSELKSYKDQCEQYRKQVIGLESKVLSMEGALNATSSIAKTLEEEKKTMSSELSQAKTNITTYQSEISKKDAEMSALRSEVSSLESKCTKLDAALKGVESKAKDDNQSMVVLESENASLLEDLKEKTLLIEKLESNTAQCKQVEDENASLKRRVDELATKELQMKKEQNKSEVFSSNTERLRKMLADSEALISSLQNDLSSARTNHHRQVTDVRAKYSSEIDGITTQLETQIAAKRELEAKKSDLEDKVLTLERKLSEVDVLREKLCKSDNVVSEIKLEVASKERIASQLRSKIQTLEGENAVISTLQAELASARTIHQQQLTDIRAKYSSEIDGVTSQLENQLAAKRELESKSNALEDKVLSLERKLSEVEYQGTHQTKAQSEQLFKLMEHADILRKKLSESSQELSAMKRKLASNECITTQMRCKIQALEGEKAITSTLQDDLSSARSHYLQQLTDIRAKYSSEIDGVTSQLEIQIAAKRELEGKNNVLEDKVLSLERKLSEVEYQGTHQTKAQSEQLSKLMKDADVLRKKLSVSSQELSAMKRELHTNERTIVELRHKVQLLEGDKSSLQGKLHDLAVEKSNQIMELQKSIDEKDDALAKQKSLISSSKTQKLQQIEGLKHIKEKLEAAKGENDMLKSKIHLLSDRKEKEINELKRAFDADRKAQDASIESLISSKEEEIQSERLAKDDLKKRIEKQSEEVAQLQKRRDSCEEELKKCREELTAAKDESSILKTKLSEVTSDYQDKANKLTAHYMKIEDEIRKQLKTTRLEKEKGEKKLAAEKKETDRLMDEFFSQKQELTSRVMELTDQLDVMMNYSSSQHHQEEVLKSTIAIKEREAKELQESMDTMKDQLLHAQTEEMTRKVEQKLPQNANSLQRSSASSKSKFKPMSIDVDGHVDSAMDTENEVNATPSNKKKAKHRKTSFQFNESPRISKAKENAAFALGSPRVPLTPRTPKTPRTQRTSDSWITPRTPRLLETDTAKSSLGYSKSEETEGSRETWEPEPPEPAAWLYIT